MLVFVSDLHFADGTAGEHNINPKAFDIFFKDIIDIARDKANAIKEVKLVFLGDIFDLLRTWAWFGYPVDERPWGTKAPALKVHAETILDDILENPINKKSLKQINDKWAKLQEIFPSPKSELICFQGNHDRLLNQFVSLRHKVCNVLPVTQDPVEEFPHYRAFEEYGVFARHGHEFDHYNYEGGPAKSREDYLKVPIGDPITTELVARIPYEIKRQLDAIPGLDPQERDKIVRNFQEIDNVRPFPAVIEWLLFQVKEREPWLIDLIEETVDKVISGFNNLQFVRDWYQRHDKWLNPFDVADQIQIALYILEKFKVFSLEKLFSLASQAGEIHFKDKLLEAAPDEEGLRNPNIRYVVYGHTHDPLVVPIRTRFNQEQLYLNTGTWRTRYQKAARDGSFMHWKNMTYVIFYLKDERPGREADFETWTGTLKTI
jgi:UDP-2,3-diacylglucosamine pyrophosphatase LpxH